VTGGRNGYGAKLANIFSTEFVIETCDGSRQKRYRQVFSRNMSAKSEPKITACKPKDNWTCVEFKPDFAKFGMDGLEEDTVALMRKRTYDLSGVLGTSVKVYYNGQRLAVKNFQDYVNLYLGPKENGIPRVHEKVGDRWEVIVSPTDGQFQQVQNL
jgi:DNA topoisomerase II